MAQITVSISDDLRDRLDKYVKDNGYATTSAFVSDAIRDALVGDGPSYWQRVNMALVLENNQILSTLVGEKRLLEGDKWHSQSMYDALTSGYKPVYREKFDYITKEELTHDQALYVYDILDVYRDLQSSAEKLGDEELQTKVLFRGFDGNNESELLGFLRYLRDNKRWDFIKLAEPSGNSHSSITMAMYPDMIKRHKEVTSKFRDEDGMLNWRSLTKKEIKYIIGDAESF